MLNPALILLIGLPAGFAVVWAAAFPPKSPERRAADDLENRALWRPIRCEACHAIVHGRDCAECGARLGRKTTPDYMPRTAAEDSR